MLLQSKLIMGLWDDNEYHKQGKKVITDLYMSVLDAALTFVAHVCPSFSLLLLMFYSAIHPQTMFLQSILPSPLPSLLYCFVHTNMAYEGHKIK